MIDFIAAGFELTGSWTIGSKRRIGFLLNIVGDLAWIYVGARASLYGLVLIAGLALGVNIRNFLKWGK